MKLPKYFKKNVFFAFALVGLISFLANSAQADDVDFFIGRLSPLLIKDWSIVRQGDKINVRFNKPCWVLFGNKINSPQGVGQDESELEIKKHGKQITYSFEMRVEPRWSDEKIKAAKQLNQRIYDDMVRLPQIYKISVNDLDKGKELPDHLKSTEQLKLESELDNLHKKIVVIPDLNLNEHCIFFPVNLPYDDEQFYTFWPRNFLEQRQITIKTIQNVLRGDFKSVHVQD